MAVAAPLLQPALLLPPQTLQQVRLRLLSLLLLPWQILQQQQQQLMTLRL
jgi:hypothetical protein